MIVIDRNGQRTVITGWRAWVVGAAVVAGLTAMFALFAVLLLGVAVTVGIVLLIAVPVAIIVGLVTSTLGRR
jgi:hypothetical protein